MNNLHEEISIFLNKAPFSQRSKNVYRKALENFSVYLSGKTKERIEDIHLERIYCLLDKDGEVIGYRPIDSNIIDEYLFENILYGHTWLSNNRNALGSFFKYLRRNYDFENVVEHLSFKLKDYKIAKRPITILDRHGFLRLLQSIVKWSENFHRDALLFSILISTGCRISEILNLKYKDIYISDDSFFLEKTKNKKQRIVIMRIGFGKVIKKYCEINKIKENEYIFQHNSKQMTRNMVQSDLDLFLNKVNISHVNIHALRHSFATMMLEEGTAITIIQQFLGHTNLESTKVYVHPNYIRNYNVTIKENEELYKLYNGSKH